MLRMMTATDEPLSFDVLMLNPGGSWSAPKTIWPPSFTVPAAVEVLLAEELFLWSLPQAAPARRTKAPARAVHRRCLGIRRTKAPFRVIVDASLMRHRVMGKDCWDCMSYPSVPELFRARTLGPFNRPMWPFFPGGCPSGRPVRPPGPCRRKRRSGG